jgi:hypothetical protein
MRDALEEFTRETGIAVKHLPAPEATRDQKALVLLLLQQRWVGIYGFVAFLPRNVDANFRHC